MYKVLLADDEQIVIDSLSFILERNFPGQLEIFTARSGSDAIDVCQLSKIDIAFMDINMPRLNGIEAIKTIKSFAPAILIIVLTAFDRFDYAQQAVNLGVFEYLSKPVNRNKIAETLRNAMSAVDVVRRKQLSEIQIREKLDSVVNIVESDFIYSLIFQSDKNGDMESYLDFFNIKDKSFYFMTIGIYDLMDSARAQVYMTLRDIISSSSSCIIGPLMGDRVVVFVPFSPGEDESVDEEQTRTFVKLLHARMTARLGLKVKIGMSGIENDLSQSLAAYNDSLKALVGSDDLYGVIHSDDISEDNENSNVYHADLEKRLLDRTMAGDIQSVHSLIVTISSYISAKFPNDIGILKGKLYEILALVRRQTKQTQVHFGGFSEWKDTWNQIVAIENSSSLVKYVSSGIDECLAVVIEHKQSRMSPIISKACVIIQENYSQEISLEEISRRVEVSPFYFSKLFKEETGENFIDFITMTRMHKAKEMLCDQSQSIKEISAATGYSDPNYFSKLFKKIVGQTPTEFREGI